MAPSVDWSAASLLCCEESACFCDDGDQDKEEWSLSFNHESAWAPLSWELLESQDIELAISALAEREIFHMPRSDYRKMYDENFLEIDSRQRAISWISKVRGFYNFGALTVALSVNYVDRFLSCQKIPAGKPWMIQLLCVACISLAAKMEEVEVPLLLDLQVDPECVFEPRTIQRMELLVLSTLEWRMSSVTPFAYIDYLVRSIDLDCSFHCALFSRVTELILCAIQELKFLSFRPSAIAVASILCAVQELVPLELTKLKGSLFSVIPAQLQDTCERCFTLLSEMYQLSPFTMVKDENYVLSAPRSPIGVLDASFSCDSGSTLKSVGSNNPGANISSPARKKRKVDGFSSSVKAYAS